MPSSPPRIAPKCSSRKEDVNNIFKCATIGAALVIPWRQVLALAVQATIVNNRLIYIIDLFISHIIRRTDYHRKIMHLYLN